MKAFLDRQLERFLSWAQPFERFVRQYTSGVSTRNVQRMFHEESLHAYEVLTRDHDRGPAEGDTFRLALHRARAVFLGLSFKLAPARRILFAAAMVFAALGVLRFDFTTGGGALHLDDAPLWFLAAIAALLFLLGLELADRIRFRDEVEVARQLQHDLLPKQMPSVPGYRFAFSYRTANDIGGDYYDFLELDDSRVGLVAGDASGHGIGAGLLMATAKAALLMAVELESAPDRIAGLMNRVLVKTGDRRAFMTLFYGVLEPASGRLDHVSAGYPFPVLRRGGSGELSELGTGALPLGIRSDLDVETHTTVLEPGDLVVLYSDGLPEAVNESTGADFGYQRLHQTLTAGGTAREVHDRIVDALESFLGDAPLMDDVSIVVIERLR